MFSPREFAKMIGRSVKTLQRWDRDGILVAKRTPTNRRYYTEEDCQWYRDWETDRKSTRLNSSHSAKSRMPSSA